jgi:hypothetical protein
MDSIAKIEEKKQKFLENYVKYFGNISKACEASGLRRSTFYLHLNKDPDFKKAIEDAEPEEVFIDFVESALVQKIKSGCTASIIFALKSKGKKRGWIERVENVNSTALTFDPDKYEQVLKQHFSGEGEEKGEES